MDFVEALGKVSRSVSPEDVKMHEKWMADFGFS
jgi:katanin p60 ATPase-containing subunit A1